MYADSLDVEQLNREIGQMLMVGVRGAQLQSDKMDQVIAQVSAGEIGGIIFFKHNIRNREQLQQLVEDLNNLPSEYPLFLAADEEGGKVRRLRQKQGFKEFPSAAYVGKKLSPLEAFDIYKELATQMRDAGLNLNLGPVVDVNVNGNSPAVGKLNRSFSTDPEKVYLYSKTFIRAHHEAGVLTTLKHFPGHGSSKHDTHNELTDITQSWIPTEQIPFQRLIDSDLVDMVMAGHLFDRELDEAYPASLSQAHIQGTLRSKLGFDGVVVTDDLQMGAIIKRYTLEDIIIAAVNSGSDILQFSDPLNLDDDLPLKMRSAIIQAIRDGKISEERIHESYQRIVSLKRKLMHRPD
ncbi:MAG: glycoside hydrolase family 3 [Candidatus Marinimicrobia bacterium]|nr:glycoside hydrolase family 3 [Candidatus Neomarinimicrobiota bacterium]